MPTCPSCSRLVPHDSAFCPGCGSRLESTSNVSTQTNLPPEATPRPETGRFLPGMVLAGRYRIVAPLGQGGMGEVFRADDTKLGQPVALKFLPRALEKDPGRLTRLFDEVRFARQVSHPNVCRVFDVGEAEGQHFITMEYVDGEDLKSLLRRIGRLPEDRALRVAREICAGLAAAHDQGILHRDLKPANVMIDGRGRARITDFGLAAVASEVVGADIRSGTPAYMAPEQLAGSGVSVRSDVYSLGLVLYEVFTGHAAFATEERIEALRQGRSSTPSNPSIHVKGLDVGVERVILDCLDPEPEARPGSALAVAAALPGADPLAAALAKGETPSPGQVAAAGISGGLGLAVAAACLAAILIGLLAATLLLDRTTLFARLGLDKPPDALQDRATEILAETDGAAPAEDSSRGFVYDLDLLGRLPPGALEAKTPEALRAFTFWYRQGPRLLLATDLADLRLSFSQPSWTVPGMAGARLDTTGRLVEMIRVPASQDPTSTAAVDWSRLLRRTSLASERLRSAEPSGIPPVFADSRWAWEAEDGTRVEAGAFRGRPVYLCVGRSLAAAPTRPDELGGVIFMILCFLSAAWLARRNILSGRGDLVGARRVASFCLVASVLGWGLLADPRMFLNAATGSDAFATFAFFAILYWVAYVALEPAVRSRWPTALTAWTRLLAGRFGDPLVGRDVVYGSLCGVSILVLSLLSDATSGQPTRIELVLKGWQAAGGILRSTAQGVLMTMLVLFLLTLLRLALRREWLVVAVAVPILLAVATPARSPLQAIVYAAALLLMIALLFRFGMLAGVVAMTVWDMAGSLGLTCHLGAWYAEGARASIVAILALAVYGFYVSTRNRNRKPATLSPA